MKSLTNDPVKHTIPINRTVLGLAENSLSPASCKRRSSMDRPCSIFQIFVFVFISAHSKTWVFIFVIYRQRGISCWSTRLYPEISADAGILCFSSCPLFLSEVRNGKNALAIEQKYIVTFCHSFGERHCTKECKEYRVFLQSFYSTNWYFFTPDALPVASHETFDPLTSCCTS